MVDVLRITKVDLQAVIRLFNACDSASAKNKMNTLSIASGRGPKVNLDRWREMDIFTFFHHARRS
jgi:hypothetical protein